MLEYRERNRNKHIISDNEVNAFAWAGYYAKCSTILVNGKSYEVFHVTDTEIEFKDGTYLPVLDHGRIVENRYYGNVFYVLIMDCALVESYYDNKTGLETVPE